MTKNIFAGRTSFAAIAAAIVLAPSVASAQDAAPAVEETEGLQEIVVTAERRPQRLQDVPIAATVLTSDDLLSQGISSTSDLQRAAPSVAISTYNRSTFINVRGVGTAQSISTGAPGVAYYIDGQLIPHDQFIAQSFYDIGSVEVLRGPQGTLTGQNSTGGAIYVRTPEPTFDSVSGFVDQTVGDYGWLRTIGAINLPFSDSVAIRAAGVYEERDSFTRNIGSSRSQPGDANLLAGRLNFAARAPGDSLRFNLRFDIFESKTDYIAVKRRGDTVSTDPYVIQEDAVSYQNQNGWRLAGEVRMPLLTGVELRTFFAWQDVATYDQADGDRTTNAPPRPPASAIGRVARGSTEYDTGIAEVNLISTGSGPFNWVLGAFHMDDTAEVSSLRDNNHVVDYVSPTAGFVIQARSLSSSIFGQTTWGLSDRFEIVAGGRYSWDRQIFTRISLNNAPPPAALVRDEPTSESFTGKFALNYHPDRNTLFYGTVARGYKAGGGNVAPGTAAFGPETNTLYEVGAKSTLFGRRLRVAAAGFYTDYKDIQLSGLLGGQAITQNAASARTWGGELELTGQFGDFAINGSVGYLRGEFAGDGICIVNSNRVPTIPAPPAPAVACPTGSETVPNGRTLPFTPEWTISAGVEYGIDLGAGLRLTPRLQWSHTASQVATPFPSSQTIVPGYNIADARLTLDINDRYQIQGFVTNLLDDTYIAAQLQDSSSVTGGLIYGAPRQYGLRLLAKFGR